MLRYLSKEKRDATHTMRHLLYPDAGNRSGLEILLLRVLRESGARMIKVTSAGEIMVDGVPVERVIVDHLMLGVNRG